MTKQNLFAAIAGVVVGLLLGASVPGVPSFGGVYNQVNNTFREGIKVGTEDQFSISKLGAIVSSAAVTLSGTLTVPGTTAVTEFEQGGGVTATSSAANATILAADLDPENVLEVSLPVGAVTLTLPASTSFPLGTTAGSYREFAIFNASSTAGAIITIAGGSGSLLEVASSTIAVGLKTIAPSGAAIFTAFRKANSDIEVFMNPGQ